MIVEKMMMAMASEKTRKPSSLAQLCSVLPRIRSPAEWRENLNILQCNDIADAVAMRKDKFVKSKLKTYSLNSTVVCEIYSLIVK